MLGVNDLLNPVSTISGEKVERKKVKHLFFKLDEFADELTEWINSKSNIWRSQVSALSLGWIKQGLKERCISRDLKHGISIPKKGFEDKVFYVWFDAPIGYLSGTKEISPKWKDFWQKKESKIYHFLGKDNIPFHTIFWPAMLMGQGKLNLPENVVGLQYLNYEGKKFSKSKKVGVFCEKLSEAGLDADIWRSYLIQVIPETGDTEFKWNDFLERVNSDLIGNYCNLVNRVLKFTKTKFDGKLEKPSKLTKVDKDLLEIIESYKTKIEDSLEKAELRKAYSEILALSSEGNKYINATEPWKVLTEDPKRANDICYNAILLLKAVTVFLAPFLPRTAERVWKQINLKGSPLEKNAWQNSLKDFGKKHEIGEPEILFNKLGTEDITRVKGIVSNGVNLAELFQK